MARHRIGGRITTWEKRARNEKIRVHLGKMHPGLS